MPCCASLKKGRTRMARRFYRFEDDLTRMEEAVQACTAELRGV